MIDILVNKDLVIGVEKFKIFDLDNLLSTNILVINIAVNKGEILGLVGESGSGKTTLAMSIMHLLSYEGEIRICEKITQEKLIKEMVT